MTFKIYVTHHMKCSTKHFNMYFYFSLNWLIYYDFYFFFFLTLLCIIWFVPRLSYFILQKTSISSLHGRICYFSDLKILFCSCLAFDFVLLLKSWQLECNYYWSSQTFLYYKKIIKIIILVTWKNKN